ncbi:50S ribosomal protein L22 [Candidatus Giovannonibacteria bacterium RIFCSPLOWO2_01_FULL_44_40]|uniref:Large ribosomal subunit protein uL22 n=1 Tax=Candidatus Giovannonibacteria bacterium RIFCSPHIGHO2_01_FULL_45_23 TaxID=1798325 RepID=A0A1F5VIU6_9BACT|nr:MAG: 50S ribosomal protein L22 [Candidatus Giovannonibacteria bacterium RIFCSPHIGHO2_01_FULL_45_23]OGF76871.1 MAG: 50S ribosomal protein L22 [Candidatus Giovannonibacteria bacterium RIFCSPHIGHO2_02_FULL_45_13]OGF80348.1 MAG: 50S ribosomal protein L22 [Candidatus Giovannonibacteria bacterium RIFCSPLOWO2_01_FULL_44_40]
MEIKAHLKYFRMSPRKVRLAADVIKGKSAEEADAALSFLQKRAASALKKLLKSAVANAKHNFSVERENLFVKSIRVDQGPALKRFMPRARGIASPIRKRSSHIELILKTKNQKPK